MSNYWEWASLVTILQRLAIFPIRALREFFDVVWLAQQFQANTRPGDSQGITFKRLKLQFNWARVGDGQRDYIVVRLVTQDGNA